MRQEQLTTIQIQQFLNSADQTDKPEYADLATNYAGMCRDLNSRLEKCVSEVKNGSGANAIYLAENEPPVLELVSILNFEDCGKWGELCEMYDWNQAPMIKAELIAQLDEAYKDHSALEPLLNEYRKKAKNAPLKEKIQLLRRIKEIDTKNQQREEDLVRFENERLLELKKEARKAIEDGNEALIKNIYLEITSPEWYVLPPDNVVAKMARELAKYRKQRLQNQGEKILYKLANAYSNFETKEVEFSLKKWDLLKDDKEFTPNKEAEKQIKEAREWFKAEHSEMEKTTAFEKLQKQFAEDMEFKRNLENIDNKYHKLLEFGKTVPDNLIQRYRQLRSDKELDAHRSHSLKLVISVVIILAIIGGLGFFIHLQIRGKEYRKWVNPIVNSAKSQDLEKLQAAVNNIKELKEKEPDFYDAKVVQAESVIHSRIEEINARNQQYDGNIKALNGIMDKNFQEYDKCVDLIKESEILLKKIGEDEQKALRLNRVKTALKAFEIKTQDERDKKFSNKALKVNQILSEVKAIDSQQKPDEFHASLQKYEQAGGKLLESNGVTSELLEEQKKMFESNTVALKQELEEGLKANREKKKLLSLIKTDFLPLSSYKLVMSKYIEQFPGESESAQIQKTLKMMPAYINGEILKNLNPETFTVQDVEKYNKLLKDHPAFNIWRNDLRKYLEYKKMFLENTENVKKSLAMLKKLRIMKFKVLRFQDKDGDIWVFYTEGKIEKKFSQINKKRYCRLKTKVVTEDGKEGKEYNFMQGDKNWKIRRGTNTIYTDLTPLSPLGKEVPFAGHVNFCSEMTMDLALKKPQEYQAFLIQCINRLKKSEDVNPYIRLQFIEKLFSLAKKLTVNNKRVYEKNEVSIQKFLKAAGDVNWLDLTKLIKQKMIEKIKDIPDLYAKAEQECLDAQMLTTAVGRRVRAVGVVQDKKLVQKGKIEFQEIWALREQDEILQFNIVGKLVDGQAEWSAEYKKNIQDLEPLFAPTDGRSTKDLTDELKNEVKSNTPWPVSWPVNSR